MISDRQPNPEGTSLPAPWLRLPARQGKDDATETAKPYAAFQMYYTLSPNQRSLRQVASQLKKRETLMEKWSSRFFWVRRTEAWDRYQAEIVSAECERKRRQDDEKWDLREEEVLDQDFKVSRQMVYQSAQTLTLPATAENRRSHVGAATVFKVAHQIGLACIDRARPKLAGGSASDDLEFTSFPELEKEDRGE